MSLPRKGAAAPSFAFPSFNQQQLQEIMNYVSAYFSNDEKENHDKKLALRDMRFLNKAVTNLKELNARSKRGASLQETEVFGDRNFYRKIEKDGNKYFLSIAYHYNWRVGTKVQVYPSELQTIWSQIHPPRSEERSAASPHRAASLFRDTDSNISTAAQAADVSHNPRRKLS